MATTTHTLRARIESIYLSQRPAMPRRLVSEELNRHPDSGIGECSSQTLICHHATDVQILNKDRLVFANNLCREFVNEVFPGIADLFVNLGDTKFGFLSVSGPFLFTGERLLCSLQLPLSFLQWLRRIELGAIGCSRKGGQAKVDANGFDCLGSFWKWFIDSKRDVVATTRSLANRYRTGLQLEGARPLDTQYPNLGDGQDFLIELKGRARELGRLNAIFLLKRRIASTLFPKVDERSLQMAQTLLSRNRTDFVQPNRFRLLLQYSQPVRSGCIVDSLLLFVPRLCTQCQRPVVNKPDTAERPRQLLLLLWCRVKAVFESANQYLQFTTLTCKIKENGIPPTIETVGFLPKSL